MQLKYFASSKHLFLFTGSKKAKKVKTVGSTEQDAKYYCYEKFKYFNICRTL